MGFIRGEMESIGDYLRLHRERRRMTIGDVARETRVPVHALEALEADRFDELPAEVFVRGFLRAYARAVSISVDETMARYTLGRRDASVAPIATQTPVQPTRRANRFGLAIGIVVILILVTVALSLALKPRAGRAASELAADGPHQDRTAEIRVAQLPSTTRVPPQLGSATKVAKSQV
jgi:cytoskeletal protein RodZ